MACRSKNTLGRFKKKKTAEASLGTADDALTDIEVRRRMLEGRQRAAEKNLALAEAYVRRVEQATKSHGKMRDALDLLGNDALKDEVVAVAAIVQRMALPNEVPGVPPALASIVLGVLAEAEA